MCFGETALLDGGGCTADAVADVDSVVHGMSAVAFDTLQQQEPALCACIRRLKGGGGRRDEAARAASPV